MALAIDIFARIIAEIGRADDEDLEALRPGLVASPHTGRNPDRVPFLEHEVKSLAIGLAAGIIFDATVIRSLLVPALMKLLGEANWWMPTWTGTLLRVPQPHLHKDIPNTPPVPVV